ncbi:SURF1 family protein [Xanthomonas sp. AmX2]|uniref:SURF1 family protein n=1 Tax=Xanthomonas sp. TaxID=29446 RepID=UPI00197E306A|nr:SURF1 family protein [Xanthomonas sp.]MBN6151342.1 SURF1 family protein [Xanthomonas sp.]
MTLAAAPRIASRARGPLLFGWAAALVVALLFCALGVWQLQRMQHKQALLDQAAHVRQRTVALADALRADDPARLAWVQGAGRFLPGQVLLDNQLRQGRGGVKLYQPFLADGSARPLLVELGWLPLPPDRTLPAPPPLQGRYALRGLLAPPPSHGLALGPALVPAPAPPAQRWLAMRMEPQAIGQALGRRDILSQVLRLDPALPMGYTRDLELLPNTLPPERHLGYAVQWFGLALAVLFTAAVLTWRSRKDRRRR